MAIDFYDAVNGDGLFDLLGKVFHAQQVINDARGTDFPTALTSILTQAENFPDSIDFSLAMASLPGIRDSSKSNLSSAMTQLQQVASAIVVEVVNADNPQANTSLTTALVEMLAQMESQSEAVDASTVTISIANVGSPVGDGVFVLSKKRGDGLIAENSIGEALKIECITDGPNASLRITADAATTTKLDSSWPLGSGTNSATVSVETARSLLKNTDFDTDAVYSNQPDDWVLTVGTRGTTVLMTTIEQQTIAIAGTPTGGYYLLHWTNAAGHTQTTAPIPYNAGSSTVQTALRALKGLELVTVTTTGTVPNYTHTITFKGHGGNVGQFTNTNRMTGATSVNEQQRITITGNPDGGTFTLTYSGQTTAALDFDSTAAEIEVALESLSNIDTMTGTGGPMPNATDMEFGGSLSGTDVSAMTINTGSLTKTSPTVTVTTTTAGGAGGVDEVQTITADGVPNGGTWTITFSGQTTSALASTANAAAVQAALEALSNIAPGDVVVTGGTLGVAAFTLTFGGTLTATNLPQVSVDDSSLLGPNVTVSIATITPGSPSQNEVQSLSLYGSPTGGTFTLTFDGQTTSGIAYNCSAGTLQTALESLSNIAPGDVTCAGGPFPGSAITVTFTFGGAYAATNVPQITLNAASLAGGGISITMSTPTQGSTGIQDKVDNFWKLNESGTGTRYDSIGSADINGAHAGVAGKIGNAAQYLTTDTGGTKSNPSGPISTVNHDFTVFGWVNLASVAAAGGAIFNGRNSGGAPLWELDISSSKARATVVTTGGGGTNLSVSATTFGNLSDSTWYFVAMRWNQSAKKLSISINAGTADEVTASTGATTSTVETLTFGYFPGTTLLVDEFGYCGELLSDAELTELYNAGTGETSPFSSSTNEVQRITVAGSPSTGTFTLTYAGQTTTDIAYDASSAIVDAALEALSNIGAGDVTCTGGPLPTAINIEFTGALAAQNVAAITSDDNNLKSSASTTTIGDPGTDEQQRITASPTPVAGTFTLTFDDTGSNPQTTSALAYNASAAQIQTALVALSNLASGDVVCTGTTIDAGNITVTFGGAYAATDVLPITASSSLTGASPTTLTPATTTEGVAKSNETQSFTLGPDVTGGTYTLTWDNGSGAQTTAAIAWNASFDDVRAALEATSTIAPGDVVTTGGPSPAAVTVTFQGAYAGLNVNAMTGSGAGLTQDAIAGTITTIRDGSPDSGSVTHVTTVPGTAQVYTGDKALILLSNGSELTCLHQKLTTLKAATPYAFCLWACHDGNAIAAGVITIDLVDGISGTVMQDDQGTNNSLAFNASDLTSSFKPLTELVAGGAECVFRTPTVLPDIIYLRVRISTAITSGKQVFLDHLILTPLTELYRGGPWIVCIGGAERFRVGDAFTLTVTNDRAGLIQEWCERNFGMSTLGLLLPSNSAGGETIPDSVVS